jgi:hypothetical protein
MYCEDYRAKLVEEGTKYPGSNHVTQGLRRVLSWYSYRAIPMGQDSQVPLTRTKLSQFFLQHQISPTYSPRTNIETNTIIYNTMSASGNIHIAYNFTSLVFISLVFTCLVFTCILVIIGSITVRYTRMSGIAAKQGTDDVRRDIHAYIWRIERLHQDKVKVWD